MAEYIEREALIQRLENSPLFTNFGEDGFFICDCVIDIIKKQPSVKSAADVVEVVRCKECKHKHDMIGDKYCYCVKHNTPIYYDDFCSCGAKMDGKDGAE